MRASSIPRGHYRMNSSHCTYLAPENAREHTRSSPTVAIPAPSTTRGIGSFPARPITHAASYPAAEPNTSVAQSSGFQPATTKVSEAQAYRDAAWASQPADPANRYLQRSRCDPDLEAVESAYAHEEKAAYVLFVRAAKGFIR